MKTKGISLIEIMVTCLIISIMITVAVPVYNTHKNKQSQTFIKDTLLTSAQLLDTYISSNKQLPEILVNKNIIKKNNRYMTIDEQFIIDYYTNDLKYHIKATHINKNIDKECYIFNIFSSGYKNSLNSSDKVSENCW